MYPVAAAQDFESDEEQGKVNASQLVVSPLPMIAVVAGRVHNATKCVTISEAR